MSHPDPGFVSMSFDSDTQRKIVSHQRTWSPYVDNGGTVLALAGRDYAIVAADTRLSVGFSIPSRNFTKIVQLTDQAVLASAGMGADRQYLHKILRSRLEIYRYQHQKEMSLGAIAQLLSNTLYSRRFFPIYAFNVLGGIDANTGEGFVFGYDAIGSFEKVKVVCSGSGQTLVQPVLDQQLAGRQKYDVPDDQRMASLSLAEAIELTRDVFNSAAERDILTGDALELYAVTASGVRCERFELRRD
ncbi:20S core proteasome subunit beta 6 [Cyanidioschyzon merolae strain 10D]|jgi:20S proteasome subunit beta 6|uniref:Proteasome subunit beta n=1 Tax=Cyanidioschyzon merolae (strain NIES-3377 / 10D) TaxID=280699 RepID=M1UXY0_CYAM1|nr:20S core proteasome subunit beta 6 [Cyanidioschyzon merolae strain 10D]BAM83406.1 20S core proteasome subunit beta 6 [Cyanidioschyzon merolae strain 10D]|eukprot:XP_005539442.1 20S core proteasome subunit beta 6 [Cyanidioschyzon merolae strain 10D]